MKKQMTDIICFDIGGTSIKSGLLKSGQLCDVKETPTPHEGGKKLLRCVADMVALYPQASCVGISTAGEVDPTNGSILLADNIPEYTGMAVKTLLQEMTRKPVAVENDVNAAALGEMHFGVGANFLLNNFLMVSYGTGIGGAIINDGRLMRGASGSAGEIGGLITHVEDIVPGEVGSGSYERYASTTALVRDVRKISPSLDSGRSIFATLSNPEVCKAVQYWINEVLYGLVGAIHLLNPQAVVLGGGVMQEEYLYSHLQNRITPMLKASFSSVKILQAELGNRAALYGAGYLAAKNTDGRWK